MATYCNNENYSTIACVKTSDPIIPVGNAVLKADLKTDKYYGDIGDVITYNLFIENIGNTWANNVIIINEVKAGAVFINSSFTINGTKYSALNPYLQLGAKIGSIKQGEFVLVSFKVKITHIPHGAEIISSSSISFNYTDDPAKLNMAKGIVTTNGVNIQIKHIDIEVYESISDKYDVRVGDEISFKINFRNKGNISANNIMFMSEIPYGTSIIKDSYTLNSQVIYGVDSNPKYGGIRIGSLSAGREFIVGYKVKVERIPPNDAVKNSSSFNYEYTIDPSKGSMGIKTVRTNEVVINIKEAFINYYNNYGIIRTCDKKFTDIGEVITYTTQLKNTGSTKANEVVLTEDPIDGTEFISNSVTINGKLEPGTSPIKGFGINVGSINPFDSITVTYKFEVITLPKCNPIRSRARVDYKFTVNNYQPNKATSIGYSEDSILNIRNSNIIARMVGDKCHANIGEIITYTLTINNCGNIPAENIRVLNKIPESTLFLSDSLTLNCKHLMFGNIERGIMIPSLNPNKTIIISFKVKVISIVESGKIKNYSKIIYEYNKDDGYELTSGEICSNNFYTNVHSVNFEGNNFLQTANYSFASQDDKVIYKFDIVNAGNIRANEIVFYDTIPEELEFIKDSLTVNGDINYSGNPKKGVVLGSLGPKDKYEVEFCTKVKKIPEKGVLFNKGVLVYKYNMDPNRPLAQRINESNEVIVNIKTPKISINKSVFPKGSSVGKTITYKLMVTNVGNSEAEEVIIRDILHPLLEFKEDSVNINGRYNNGNIINGINIGKLRPGVVKEITFTAEIVGIPEEGIIETTSLSRYKFKVDPKEALRTTSSESNLCKLIVERINVVLKKQSNSSEINIGSIITYNVEIENKSSVKVGDFIFKDELPGHLEFDKNSFTINGVALRAVNIRSGVMIRYINSKSKVNLTYRVKIKSIPHNCKIENTAYGEFSYKLLKDSPVEFGRTNMAKTELRIPLPSFKQITVDNAFRLPPDKPNIVEVENVRVNVEVSNSYISKNPSTVLGEDGNLTGYKLMVSGFIKCDVEYTAEVDSCGVYSVSFRKPFTTYIMLSSNFERTRDIDVRAFAEDVSYNVVGPREIRVNTIFMVDGKQM